MTHKPSAEDTARDKVNFLGIDTTEDQHARFCSVRTACLKLATLLRKNCQPGRELALALTNLEQAMFWAVQAVERDTTTAPEGSK